MQSNRLKELRLEQGMPQRAVAIRASVSPTTVGAIEKWDYFPSESVRRRIAATLGVRVTEIWPAGDAVPVA